MRHPRQAPIILEKAFTAKDAKDAKENKGQSIVCRITHLVFDSNSSSLLSPCASLASFAVQSLDLGSYEKAGRMPFGLVLIL